MTLFQFYLC